MTSASELKALDGWENLISGFGTSCDSTTGWIMRRTPRASFHTLDNVYREDKVYQRVIDLKVDDALRAGWELVYDAEDGVDAEKVNDINKRIRAWQKTVNFKTKLSRHKKQARAYGGSLLVYGINDGQEADQPVNLEGTVRSLDWIQPFDRFQVDHLTVLSSDPESPYFGFPEQYFLRSRASVQSSTEQTVNLNGVRFHASRAWRTDGVNLSDHARMDNQNWGDSIYQGLQRPVKAWNAIMSAVDSIIGDFTQGIYTIDGLKTILESNAEAVIQKRFALQDRLKSIINAVLLDSNESYQRQSTSVAGLADLIDRVMIWYSAASGMSLVKLFGISPGGFGTGEAEGENWDDQVQNYQTDDIEPTLNYTYKILLQTPEFSDVPKGWSIKFNPLKLADPKEDSEIRNKQADTDIKYIQAGVLSPPEVAQSRFGGDEYSTETTIDLAIRESTAEMVDTVGVAQQINQELEQEQTLEAQATEQPDEEVAKTSLQAGQITALQELVTKVKNGSMPVESAIQVALFSFPTMDPATAEGILRPAADNIVPAQPVPLTPFGGNNEPPVAENTLGVSSEKEDEEPPP